MKILIAAGGSGGHIFPAVALARKLAEKDPGSSVLFVGSNKTLDRNIFTKERVRYALLSANKLPYGVSPKLALFFWRMACDVIKSFFILAGYRPDLVVGFGGYVSVPVSLIAYIFRTPVIAHEQNVVPGRANRFLFRLAAKIGVSFEETKELLGKNAHKAVFTGIPLRATVYRNERAESAKKLGFVENKFTILVIGGSQGSHTLNEKFIEAVSRFDRAAQESMQIVHITGLADYEWAMKKYKETRTEHRVYSFIDTIEDAYSVSDLVVTRSGASAIFEVALFGKPMILIPYPFAMSHQHENAKVFSEKGAAITIEEKELSPEIFKDTIVGLMNDRTSLGRLAAFARRLSVPGSSDSLAREAIGMVRKGRRCS